MVVFSCMVIVLCIFLWDRIRLLDKRNLNFMLQQELMKEHYTALEQQIDQISKIRQELSNQVYELETLQKEEALSGEMESYKHALKTTVEHLQEKVYCEDIVINSVLVSKLKKVKEKNIKVQCDIGMFEVGDISRIDVLGLLFNIFDNAIEASERVEKEERSIYIRIGNEGKSLQLKISNTKNPDFQLKKNEKTTKADKKRHGIGREIIKGIVKKYHGKIEIQEEENRYTLCLECIC